MKSSSLSLVLVLALVACKPAAQSADAGATAGAATAAPSEATAVAPDNPAPDADHVYDLTMANVDAMIRAQGKLADAMQDDPSLDPAINASRESQAQYIARLDSTPKIREAIESAGLSVQDYAYTTQALVATMMVLPMVDGGQVTAMPTGVNTHNVEFVRAHGKEIEAKMLGAAQR